jgi:3-vinyl bacteriochlorophyllide hydratase
VQAVLAPVQFLVFLVSLGLVLRALVTGRGGDLALLSVVIKTLVLYAIMVTGAMWERAVFGRYLFAGPFFWEDVVSMLVLALHTLYLWAWGLAGWPADRLFVVALLAYGAYLVNAAQFVFKFRMARRQRAWSPAAPEAAR